MTSSPQIPAVDPVKLDRLAEVAIKIGLQLQPGQDLLITAPLAAVPLVRRITEHAYKAGAGLVTSLYSDEEATLMRYRNAPDESFDRATGWLFEGMAKAFSANTARLAVAGDNPMLLSSEDPEKVVPRQPGTIARLSACVGKNHQFRSQLEHRFVSRIHPGRSKYFPIRIPKSL